MSPFFPLGLFIVNIITRSIHLTSEDISLDEPFTIYHAQFPIVTIIKQLKGYNNPPLYELILHFWIKAFGISSLSVRVLPMLFACLCPVALYFFAKKYFSLRIAFASSSLLTFSSLLMYYSHDSRVYSLFLLLSILSMHFYLNTLYDNRKSPGIIVLFISFTTLLIYAHYFSVFIIFFQGLHIMVFHRDKIKRFFLYYAITLLLYLPHMYSLLIRFGDSVKNGTWLKSPSGMESLYNMLWTFSNYPLITVICISILLLALGKFIRLKSAPVNVELPSLISVWFLIPYLGMFFISYRIPMYLGRYLIFVLPAYYILLVLCVDYLFKNFKYKNLILLFLVAGFMVTLDTNPGKNQPVSKSIARIREFKKQNTVVLVYPAYFLPTFAYNYNIKAFSEIYDSKEYYLTDSMLRSDNIFHIQTRDDIPDLSKNHNTEILFFTIGKERSSFEDPVHQVLDSTFKMKWKEHLGVNWYLSLFKHS